jgi:hypothetical protein
MMSNTHPRLMNQVGTMGLQCEWRWYRMLNLVLMGCERGCEALSKSLAYPVQLEG